jgi:hypothetical protein
MPRVHRSFMALVIGAAALGLIGCDAAEDAATDGANGRTPAIAGVDREAILNELDEVRQILADSGSTLQVDSISDVEFSDGTLRLTTSDTLPGLAEAETLCGDVHAALEMSNVSVEVVDETGALVTSCGS